MVNNVSLVVIAERGRNTPGLAAHISRQLEFRPSVNLKGTPTNGLGQR